MKAFNEKAEKTAAEQCLADEKMAEDIKLRMQREEPMFFASIEGTWNLAYEIQYRVAKAKGDAKGAAILKSIRPPGAPSL
jgi:hypothetical protein